MILTVTALFTGLLIFFVSLPLIYRKVPMNGLYGVRIEEAHKTEKHWYEINAYGGRQFAKWSFLITVTGIAGFWIPPRYFSIYSLVITAVTLIAVFIPVFQILKWADKNNEPNKPGKGTA